MAALGTEFRRMVDDTTPGGRERTFPLTHRSVIAAAASADPGRRQQANEAIIAAYWKPIYKYIKPNYAELAEEFGLPVTQVNNHLAYARRQFRSIVLERLRESSGSDAEYRSEAYSPAGG
jgi:hypothetical protein